MADNVKIGTFACLQSVDGEIKVEGILPLEVYRGIEVTPVVEHTTPATVTECFRGTYDPPLLGDALWNRLTEDDGENVCADYCVAGVTGVGPGTMTTTDLLYRAIPLNGGAIHHFTERKAIVLTSVNVLPDAKVGGNVSFEYVLLSMQHTGTDTYKTVCDGIRHRSTSGYFGLPDPAFTVTETPELVLFLRAGHTLSENTPCKLVYEIRIIGEKVQVRAYGDGDPVLPTSGRPYGNPIKSLTQYPRVCADKEWVVVGDNSLELSEAPDCGTEILRTQRNNSVFTDAALDAYDKMVNHGAVPSGIPVTTRFVYLLGKFDADLYADTRPAPPHACLVAELDESNVVVYLARKSCRAEAPASTLPDAVVDTPTMVWTPMKADLVEDTTDLAERYMTSVRPLPYEYPESPPPSSPRTSTVRRSSRRRGALAITTFGTPIEEGRGGVHEDSLGYDATLPGYDATLPDDVERESPGIALPADSTIDTPGVAGAWDVRDDEFDVRDDEPRRSSPYDRIADLQAEADKLLRESREADRLSIVRQLARDSRKMIAESEDRDRHASDSATAMPRLVPARVHRKVRPKGKSHAV